MDRVLADHADDIVMSLGLRKEHRRWVVAHEHHSFPLAVKG
jgi:ketosteroid isomerase-like protein